MIKKDIGKVEYIILGLILISLALKATLVPFNEGLWWDEAVYMGLGRSITHGVYSLEPGTSIETFRPFLFPFIISPLSGHLFLARMFVVLISAVSAISVYLLAKKIFDRRTAIWSAFLLSTSYLFVFFSTKALTEPLFIAMLSFSILFFAKSTEDKKKRWLFLAGVFAGLTFLTRYLGVILIFSYLIYYIYQIIRAHGFENIKSPITILIGILITLSPWFLLNYIHYNDPIGGFTENFAVYAKSSTQTLGQGIYDIFSAWGVTTLLVIGLFFLYKKKKISRPVGLILILFVVTILAYLLLPHKEPRYILSFFPVYAILCGFGLNSIGDKFKTETLLKIIVIIISVLILSISLYKIWDDRFAANGLVQACIDLKGLTDPSERVMAISYPYIYYLSERNVAAFPDESDIIQTLDKRNIKYILVYRFEPENPEYINTFFDEDERFQKIKTYDQWGHSEITVIYRYSPS